MNCRDTEHIATVIPAEMAQRLPAFVALRRDIHAHPELGLKEARTSELVASRLAAWGYTVTRGLASTGVVGQLQRGKSQRKLGLRADMDALPIEENTGLSYSSRHAGVMHACGHDGHTAMLLAAAQHLAEHGQFDGTLNLIFQPAEEHPGGAKLMIRDGLFEQFPCDAVYAMHNMPGVPQGHLVFVDGAAMASSDDVTITLHGTGGHGAMPHQAADPIVAAASVVMALQSIVSRNVDPRHAAVITVGAIHGGQANNVIPPSVRLELSVRALDREVRNLLEQRIHALVEAQAASFGVRAEITYLRDYPVLVNTALETELAREVGVTLVGEKHVVRHGQPLTGSEDFAVMLEHCPGSYLMIGNGAGEPGTSACMVHNPAYDFNDANIGIGAAYWVALTERFLASIN
jgi:hippurate hydrolase